MPVRAFTQDKPVTLRLPAQVVQELKRIGFHESLKAGVEIRYTDLIRLAIEKQFNIKTR